MDQNENLIMKGELIINKYDILDNSKEKYNIFEILGIERDEVNLHSKFIFQLLNIQEKNSLTKEFFRCFMEIVLREKFHMEDEYSVVREYETVKYGRIDFYIKNKTKNYGYAVEMKIDADDQEGQLKRYEAFLKKEHNEKYKLYYLTLDGYEPSGYSADKETIYITVSFKADIVRWIEKCLEKSYSYPMLRETLKQYLNCINKISNNLGDDKKMELKELLLKGKNLRIAAEMSETIEELKNEIEVNFWNELRERIENELEIEDHFDFIKLNEWGNRGKRYAGKEILFYKDISKSDQILSYGLGRAEGKIYFLIGIEEENANKEWHWATKKVIAHNQEMKEKLNKVASRMSLAFWEHIDDFDFKSEDFYILLEEDRKDEKEKLIASLIETFRTKYRMIEELF